MILRAPPPVRRVPLVLAAAALVLLPASGAAAAPRVHTVVIDKMKFGPVPASLRPGDTIIWVNKDMFRHTATARNGSFNVDLPPNSRGKTVIRAKGAPSQNINLNDPLPTKPFNSARMTAKGQTLCHLGLPLRNAQLACSTLYWPHDPKPKQSPYPPPYNFSSNA